MGQPLRLLLIEDSQNDAELLLRSLRRGGYEVTERKGVGSEWRLDESRIFRKRGQNHSFASRRSFGA